MRFTKQFLAASLALIIVLATVAPAYAEASAAATGTVQVQIQNKTGAEVTLSLSGPASYTFYLNTGKNKVNVLPGKYTYSYRACGINSTGKFNAKSGTNLTLPKCPGEISVTIKNYTGGNITIYLSGPLPYYFTFPTGTSKMHILAGTYTYTVYGCGSSITGTKKFKGGGLNWSFWCN